MANWAARRDLLCRRHDRIRINAVMSIEIGDRTSLAKMFNAQRANAMAADRAQPGESRRMSVEDSHQAAMVRHAHQETFDVRTRVRKPALARPLRRHPARIETVGRRNGQKTDVAPV